MLFLRKSLCIDLYIIEGRCRLTGTHNALELFEAFQFNIVKAHEIIVINGCIIKAVSDGLFGVHTLELLHHRVHAVRLHFGALNGNHGAKIEEIAHNFAVFTLPLSCLAGFARNVCRFCQHL